MATPPPKRKKKKEIVKISRGRRGRKAGTPGRKRKITEHYV